MLRERTGVWSGGGGVVLELTEAKWELRRLVIVVKSELNDR